MPTGTCGEIAAANGGFLQVTIEEHLLDGAMLIDVRYTHDGVSTRETGCDGPIVDIRVRNTATVPGFARLPNKRRGNKWIEIAPGTDQTISSGGQLKSLGLETYADVAGVALSSTSV